MPNTAARPLPDRASPQEEGQRPVAPSGSLDETLSRPGAMASPVAQLQAALGAEFAVLDDEERWPLRWTVAMVFTTCGAFWTGVYFLVAALIG